MAEHSWKVPITMIVAGILCGIMLWVALGLVAVRQGSEAFTLASLIGACIGGALTGMIMHLLG